MTLNKFNIFFSCRLRRKVHSEEEGLSRICSSLCFRKITHGLYVPHISIDGYANGRWMSGEMGDGWMDG